MFTCTECTITKPSNEFYKRNRKGKGICSECKTCFKERMGKRHQYHKDILVKQFGGKCQHCGYNICTRVLVFHHIDPNTKSFEISEKLSSNLSILEEECKKCILLCPNCHAEKHQHLW